MNQVTKIMSAYPDFSPEAEKLPKSVLFGRLGTYCMANLLFMVLLLIFRAFSVQNGHDPLPYLFLLFALCSYPLVMVKEPTGRFCLLVIAGPLMFLFFGFNDLLSYFMELKGRYLSPAEDLMTSAEMVILSGISSLFIGYALAILGIKQKGRPAFSSDWKTWQIITIGLICTVVGVYATWIAQISVDLNQKFLVESQIDAGFMILGRMVEPVGAVLLSYAYMKSKNFKLLLLILVIAAVKLPIGIILNSKEIGISFAAIFIMTHWIYTGRIPYRWVIILSVVIVVYFPISYAYRASLGASNMTVSKSMDDIDQLFVKAEKYKKKDETASGIKKFASRNDYKSMIDLIVNRVGRTVRFQGGHTLAELPYAFVPRLVYPGKPAVSTGQLFNREFHVSLDRNSYVSASFLGEFYWNFGWAGTLLGMFCMGFFWGVIGRVANIRDHASVAKMLILISAIYLLIVRFETGIAQQTVQFLRSLLIIYLLDVLLRIFRGGGATYDTPEVPESAEMNPTKAS
ncbi:MAG: hypothetical protein HXX17_05945 [Geobacteraceae bacterium]|nr:hypothetical protein [Geobacteraceae bacterium]